MDKIRVGIIDVVDKMKLFLGSYIIVDVGNGVGGFFVEKVLVEFGVDIFGS